MLNFLFHRFVEVALLDRMYDAKSNDLNHVIFMTLYKQMYPYTLNNKVNLKWWEKTYSE